MDEICRRISQKRHFLSQVISGIVCGERSGRYDDRCSEKRMLSHEEIRRYSRKHSEREVDDRNYFLILCFHAYYYA